MSEAQRKRLLRVARWAAGLAVLGWAVGYLMGTVDGRDVGAVAGAVAADPLGLGVALLAYTAAFGARTVAWRRVLPGVSVGQAWAAIHVSLLGNHVLPMRLGEALRPASVVRRTPVAAAPAIASTVTVRAADLLAVVLLAAAAAPALVGDVGGPAGAVIAAGTLLAVLAAAVVWSRRIAGVERPGAVVAGLTLTAWLLEAAVVWQVAAAAGVQLSAADAVGVTAVTIVAQAVALTPGGLGTYEAAATAALVATGVDAGTAFAVALTTHAVKTAYALAAGGVALFRPAPSFWGRFRLPRGSVARPAPVPSGPDDPVVAVIPVYDEAATVGHVVARLPRTVDGRRVVAVVVDDGSTDGSGHRAAAAGAHVVRHPVNRGLGAAVRTGLAEACAWSPAAVVYLDADGEYRPEEVGAVAAAVLAGDADYVVGSRFAGSIRRMHPHRRVGNQLLTVLLRWVVRRPDITDGQSGFRAFSAAAAADAEIVHDYNYAQVLTVDLVGKGYRYAEVPISYAFRESGTSFVTPLRYLRRVVPAVRRAANGVRPAQSSTTWVANRARAAAQTRSSREPSARSAVTAS